MTKFLRIATHPGGKLVLLTPAAAVGEWAVPGAFCFWDTEPAHLGHNFRHGFYGLDSFAWSPIVEIAEISDGELDQVRYQLAMHLVYAHGAPGLGAAYNYVDQEVEHTQALCDAPPGVLLTVERRLDGDNIHEDYKQVKITSAPMNHSEVRIWGPEAAYIEG